MQEIPSFFSSEISLDTHRPKELPLLRVESRFPADAQLSRILAARQSLKDKQSSRLMERAIPIAIIALLVLTSVAIWTQGHQEADYRTSYDIHKSLQPTIQSAPTPGFIVFEEATPRPTQTNAPIASGILLT